MGSSVCCSTEKAFMYVNIAFAMYAGSLLVTAVRLTWDPSTYAWFRFLCEQQYRITTGYVFSVGVYLTILVYVASSALFPPARRKLQIYFLALLILLASEVVYIVWIVISMQEWWENSNQAELIRSGFALQDDFKSLLTILEKHYKIPEEVQIAMNEVEHDGPINCYLMMACLSLSLVLQVTALVLSWCLQIRDKPDDTTKSWGQVNRYMYSIIDKVLINYTKRRGKSKDIQRLQRIS